MSTSNHPLATEVTRETLEKINTSFDILKSSGESEVEMLTSLASKLSSQLRDIQSTTQVIKRNLIFVTYEVFPGDWLIPKKTTSVEKYKLLYITVPRGNYRYRTDEIEVICHFLNARGQEESIYKVYKKLPAYTIGTLAQCKTIVENEKRILKEQNDKAAEPQVG